MTHPDGVGGIMPNIEDALQNTSELLFEKLEDLLPDPSECRESRLVEAMRYAALSPGKRLRPFLTVTTASMFSVSKSSALQAAAAIELVHTYSLIHDDLPAMDDDDLRRGQPSCHKKFDEATAILAGDALLSYAFEVLADRNTHSSNTVRCELMRVVAKASGYGGMAGGQMLDMLAEKTDLSINEIIHLQRLKTGALFGVSCEAGAILGSAADNLRARVRAYAHDLGLVFQITDDLLDVEGKKSKRGKRNDKTAGKATFVSAMGVDKAREQALILAKQATRHLEPFGKSANLLRDVAEYIVGRNS